MFKKINTQLKTHELAQQLFYKFTNSVRLRWEEGPDLLEKEWRDEEIFFGEMSCGCVSPGAGGVWR